MVPRMKTKKKAMTVRLPLDLYRASARIAKHKQVSLSGLVRQSLEATLESERRAELYEAFGRVAASPDESDIDFAFEAQAEVVRDGED